MRKIVNEDEIDRHLIDLGFDVVWPETLTLEAQIGIWFDRDQVASFSGSALRVGVFAPGVENFLINYSEVVDSSFFLCNWSNATRGYYHYFDEGEIVERAGSGDNPLGEVFNAEARVKDPRRVAEGISRVVEFAQRRATPRSPARRRPWSSPVPSRRENLALNRPTMQSSTYADIDISGRSATSGHLTGRYQVHTEHEAQPWLLIDLERLARIEEIVVYNRTDIGAERLRALSIGTSTDGIDFAEAYRETALPVFGGLNGEPLRVSLAGPVDARFVKLTLLGHEFLHLDQVEVLGIAV